MFATTLYLDGGLLEKYGQRLTGGAEQVHITFLRTKDSSHTLVRSQRLDSGVLKPRFTVWNRLASGQREVRALQFGGFSLGDGSVSSTGAKRALLASEWLTDGGVTTGRSYGRMIGGNMGASVREWFQCSGTNRPAYRQTRSDGSTIVATSGDASACAAMKGACERP